MGRERILALQQIEISQNVAEEPNSTISSFTTASDLVCCNTNGEA